MAEDYDYEFGPNCIVHQASFTVTTLPPVQADRQYIYGDTNRIFQVIDNGFLNVEYIYNGRGQRTEFQGVRLFDISKIFRLVAKDYE